MPYQYYQPFSFYIIFYSYPVTNSSTLPICFVSNFFLKFSSTSKTTPISSHRIIPSEDILWLSFNSVTISLGSLFLILIRRFYCQLFFETLLRHHYISSFLSSDSLPKSTTLYYFLHHLQLLKNNI